jgi:3D (Asp-Asp-Asp) domain-containing protein
VHAILGPRTGQDADGFWLEVPPDRCDEIPVTRSLLLPALATGVLLAGCAGRKLPPFEKPLRPAPVQTVRTTAYTHSEKDHRKWGRKSAAGTELQRGEINSAAADWSRWPLGTVFRIRENGEVYRVDDYGWMLAGTNTIDLYKPSKSRMNQWGVRRVTIDILEWGDPGRSYALLKPRQKHRHVKRMVRQLEDRYDM